MLGLLSLGRFRRWLAKGKKGLSRHYQKVTSASRMPIGIEYETAMCTKRFSGRAARCTRRRLQSKFCGEQRNKLRRRFEREGRCAHSRWRIGGADGYRKPMLPGTEESLHTMYREGFSIIIHDSGKFGQDTRTPAMTYAGQRSSDGADGVGRTRIRGCGESSSVRTLDSRSSRSVSWRERAAKILLD
jgi:hypothetical protein